MTRTLAICKNCCYYNLTIAAIEQHAKENAHEWQIIHTTTQMERED